MSSKKNKRKTYFLITGNKIIDGILTILVGFIFFSIPIGLAYTYGAFNNWWKFFGVWGHLLAGICLFVLIPMGFIYFSIGCILFVRGIFERLLIPEKVWVFLLVYIPALVCITYLTAIQILPPPLFEAIFYKLLYLILGAGIGYYIGKAGV